MKLKKSSVNNIISYGIVIIAFIVCQSMISSGAMSCSLRGQMIPICVYIVMAVSLNLVVGISGELSLGHAGFMSVGAFSGAIVSAWMLAALNMENEILRLVLSMVLGLVIVPVVSLFTKIRRKEDVDRMFSCYDSTVTVRVTTSLVDEQE